MKSTFIYSVLIVILLTIGQAGYGQAAEREMVAGIPVNYDESLSGSYTLPDPLVFPDGKKVKSAGQWYRKRRPQIVALFEKFQFGRAPATPKDLVFNLFDRGTAALNGTAVRKQITVYMTGDTSDHKMDLLIYLPAGATKPVPLFFNISFSPNANVVDDPGIKAGFIRNREGKLTPVQRRGGYG